jgi:hypothetical protein
MATDGARIVYNPAFVDHLSPAEVEGTLAHEVMHCALGHQCRRGGRDPELWNRATDFAINPILIANGLTLPTRALIHLKLNTSVYPRPGSGEDSSTRLYWSNRHSLPASFPRALSSVTNVRSATLENAAK